MGTQRGPNRRGAMGLLGGVLLGCATSAVHAQGGCPSPAVRTTGALVALDATAAMAAAIADWRADAPATGWRWFPGRDVRAQLTDATAPLHVVGSFRLVDGLARHLQARCHAAGDAWRWALLYGALGGLVKEGIDGWYGGATPADLLLNAAGLALGVAHVRSAPWQAVVPAVSVDPGRLRRGEGAAALGGWLLLTPQRVRADGTPARGGLALLRVGLGRRVLADGRSQLLVGLDLDPAGLPIESARWRPVLEALRAVRWPGPTLVIENGGVRGLVVGW